MNVRAIFRSALLLFFFSGTLSAQQLMSARALNAKAGSTSLYEISLQLDRDLLPASSFRILFPEECDVSDVRIAGSKDIDGGLRIRRDGQALVISRSGLGTPVRKNTQMKFIVGPVGNPASLALAPRITFAFASEAFTQDALQGRIEFIKK